jgi:hypothetical protein
MGLTYPGRETLEAEEIVNIEGPGVLRGRYLDLDRWPVRTTGWDVGLVVGLAASSFRRRAGCVSSIRAASSRCRASRT